VDRLAGLLKETAPCKGSVAESNDCVWGSWMEWGPCSQTCGGGLHSRSRSIEKLLWVVSRAQVHLQKQMAVMQASAQMLRRPARLVLGPNGVTALQVCRSSENVRSFPKVAMAEHHARCP